MKKTFYAKPNQTYSEHLRDVHKVWKEIVEAKKGLLQRLSAKYGFTTEAFLVRSLLTIALHDIGKVSNDFQNIMQAKREGKPFNYKHNYRHELSSFPFALYAANGLAKSFPYSLLPLEALAVVGHHKTLNTDLTSFARELHTQRTPELDSEGLELALSEARQMFIREGREFPSLPDTVNKGDGLAFLAKLMADILPQLLNREDHCRIRDLYLLIKGVLHYSDWCGSAGSNPGYSVNSTQEQIINHLKERCTQRNITFNGLSPFQAAVASQSGHVIAIAPTGSGKTEASVLWALRNIAEMGRAKLIYLLPTMATANSIWLRLGEFFGRDKVGLSHSSASLLLEHETEDQSEKEENYREVLFDQTFIRPVTVATIDQLLATGFNSKHWVVKEINAANSVIILDEIHAYDGWTMGLIVASIRRFAALGTRFLLMSATMPQNLIDLFREELPTAAVIRDNALLLEVRSNYFVEDKSIGEATEEIAKAVKDGHRVMVVVNTVEQCQELARHFAYLDPVCFHSRFILRDRQYLEGKLDKARFVIATQIVEVSLDLDYDWLFTECAPPDAIAQRAGRVNRYRDPNRDSRIYIFRPGEKSGKLYNPLNDQELLVRSFEQFKSAPQALREQDILEVIEKVYKHCPVQEREGFQEALEQYRLSQNNRMVILDNRKKDDQLEQTRLTKYETISVIPYCFYEEVQEIQPSERRLYEVKVPYWFFKQNGKKLNGIMFCEMLYDSLLGATLKPDNSPVCF